MHFPARVRIDFLPCLATFSKIFSFKINADDMDQIRVIRVLSVAYLPFRTQSEQLTESDVRERRNHSKDHSLYRMPDRM
jgi:hypothetical protein